MSNDKCFHIDCVSNELCMPTLSSNPDTINNINMMLVRPVLPEDSWGDIIRQEGIYRNTVNKKNYYIVKQTIIL